jgi:hypothetical protein
MTRLEIILELGTLLILDLLLSIIPLFHSGWQGHTTVLGLVALSFIIIMAGIKLGRLEEDVN